jgi:hypothetical protein
MSVFLQRSINGGEQIIYKFENNFGASVVRHNFSYGNEEGLWELGVIEFTGDKWGLTYDTVITDDVLGHLSDEDVSELLIKIEQLENK